MAPTTLTNQLTCATIMNIAIRRGEGDHSIVVSKLANKDVRVSLGTCKTYGTGKPKESDREPSIVNI